MVLRRSLFLPLSVAVASWLGACARDDQPLAPQVGKPQFSQTATAVGTGKIAFQSDRDGDFEIFVMNADGSDVTQLTHNTVGDYLPRWSPDGTRLTYGGNCTDVCDVMVINADGTGEHSVFHDGFPGAWSPDGTRIAFSRGDGVYVVYADGGGYYWVAPPQFVTDWSPDGRRLLLGNDFTGNLEIYSLALDSGGVTTQLTNDPGNDGGAKWSPDGTRIAFNSDRDGGDGDVFVMNADGSGVTDLTQNDGITDGLGDWSPDGTQLVFSSNRDGDDEIFVMNADGTGAAQVTTNDGISDGGPSWFERIAPPNDDFANAAEIAGLPFDQSVNLLLASTETGEVTPTCAIYYPPVSKTVWYRFVPAVTGALTARVVNTSISTVVTAYTGSSVDGLSEVGCQVFGGSVTFQAQAGTAYYFLVGGLFDQGGPVEFRLEVTPPPIATMYFFPGDPSSFDAIQFYDGSFDPGGVGVASQEWSFGDGASASGCCPTHRYATDGSYTTQLTVTTLDGRTGSTSQTVVVRTHDVVITKFTAPVAASSGQTRQLSVALISKRYSETVEVQLYKSVPNGYEFVGSRIQSVPARSSNRTTDFNFSYTFTGADAQLGKVTFKAVAYLSGARDALPADNEAVASPTKVNR